MSAHKLHVQQRDASSFRFYHRTLNQTCSAAKSLNASLQCAWNPLVWNCCFSVCICVSFQPLLQGTDCFTKESQEGRSQGGWEAFAFWVLPMELRAGREVHQQEQNTVICASWHTPNCSGFLCPVSWLLLCGTLIFVRFLGSTEVSALLCAA